MNPTRRFLHRTPLAAGVALVALATAGTGIGLAQQSAGDSPTAAATIQDESPAAYGSAAFDAWLSGDAAALIERTSPEVAQLLLARDPGDERWAGHPLCEGAAGSTYCTWISSADIRLVLRVANEAASLGESHAVAEASFIPTVDSVAIWPLSTQEEAENTQTSVDEGHSPWMVDPATVAIFHAQAELGWQEPVVEATGDPASWRITDSASGVAVRVELAQPVRTGPGGIWVVTSVSSALG